MRSDDTIGAATVALPQHDGEWSLESRWYALSGEDGKPAGRVRMSVAWEDQTGQEEYDAADLITHFDTRAEKANANRQPELQQAPGYLLRQRSAAADGEAHLSGVVTDALGGAHIRMFATPRSRDWKDNGEHSYMLTVGFLQSVNMAPSPEIRCDMVLSKRDRTKEPLREARGVLSRCLLVSVLECRDLKKADLFGKNDVFATLVVDDDSKQQSSTIDDGGSAPKWGNGSGETFMFEMDRPGEDGNYAAGVSILQPAKLELGIWDEDVGSASDQIGSHIVDLAATDLEATSDWKSAQWLELSDDKGKAVGEAHVLMRWAPPPPAQDAASHWQLRAKIIECDQLKKMDTFGKNDVYVKVHAGAVAGPQRTETIDGGGAAPKWGSGAGEELAFELTEPPPAVGIEVFDEDRDRDDLIGSVVFEVGSKIGGKAWSAEKWLELTDAKGKVTGRVRVVIFWERKPEPLYCLACSIVECKELKKANVFGKNDVYVTMTTGGQRRKTSTIEDGGQAPVWADGDGETLSWDVQAAPDSVELEVWDEDVGSKDDLIGRLRVPLGRLLAEDGYAAPAEWKTLVDEKGATSGMVKLRVNWHRLPTEARAEQSLTAQPSVLPSKDSTDANDRIRWGSSKVFRVDDASYQKLHGSFYLESRPDRKLGEFTAGLRGVHECTETYKDTWITVRPPSPTLTVSVEWNLIPQGKDVDQPVGTLRFGLVEALYLNSHVATAGKSELSLRCELNRQNPFRTTKNATGDVPLSDVAAIMPLDEKMTVVRRMLRTVELRCGIWQAAEDGDPASAKCLLTFATEFDSAWFEKGVAQNVVATVERDTSDALRAEALRQFEDVDEDGSGFLDRDEIRRLSHAVGAELGETELNDAMAEMDRSGTGEVNFEDYYAWWTAQRERAAAELAFGGGAAGATTGAAGMLGGLFARKKKDTRSKGKSLVSKALASEKDTATARQAFDAVDADGSGGLDAMEIRQLAVSLGMKMEKEEVQDAMLEMRGTAVDQSELTFEQKMSGYVPDITFEQFNAWWSKRGQSKSGALAGIRGKLGNRLTDGIIQKRTIKKQEQGIAERQMVREAFDVIDVDKSGTLDSVELRALLKELYPDKLHTQEELLTAMREMRQEEGADYDAITFDNFYMWWISQKDKKDKGKVRAPHVLPRSRSWPSRGSQLCLSIARPLWAQ